jgi:hypothetical protein
MPKSLWYLRVDMARSARALPHHNFPEQAGVSIDHWEWLLWFILVGVR